MHMSKAQRHVCENDLTISTILYTSEGINKLTDLSNCSSQIGKQIIFQ